ncbi:MAG: sodium:solute symporter family protein [Bacteroidota bacterium]
MVYAILLIYIAVVFLGSLRGAKQDATTPEGYFLANRSLGTLTLFFTILATNFSAFYFLGFAGEGYRVGYTYYVVMALGTGFAAFSFFLLGTKIWRLGKEHGHITPGELIYQRTGSNVLRWLYALVMILFTFPYLSLQIVGAGYILETITQQQIPYLWGATFLTLFTIAYVWIGGMRSVAKTDLKQGLLAIGLMLAAVLVITNSLGGLTNANEQVFALEPSLFNREGAGDKYPPQKWFSILIFWLFCIPMFPQIFMRFYVAKDLDKLKKSALLYGGIPLIISLFPVIIGVLGHLSFPGLEGKAADQILPMMLVEHSSEWFAALVLTGALAAFMSTLDSQLLALSTIVTRDFVLPFRKGLALSQQVKIGRICVILFAIIGLGIAARPFDTIFDMGKLAFSGLSMLFPITLAVLYWKVVSPAWAVVAIIIGEVLLLAFYYEWLPNQLLLGFDAYLFAMIVVFIILGLGAVWGKPQKRGREIE